MKKLKLLCLCLIITFVLFKVNGITAIRSASAQEVPNFDELTAVDESDAATVKYSRPKDDTRVTESDPRVNYGKSKYLAAGRWKKGRVESYIKFDVRKGYRADKLYIYLVSGKTSGLTVYSSSRNWSERKIIWRNRPSKGSKLDSSANKSGSWWEFDVSSVRSSSGEYSFAITGPSNKIVNFYSKEGKRAPRLSYVKGEVKTPGPTNKTTNPTSTTNATSTANPSSSATNNPTSSPTDNPTVAPTNTDQPTIAPSPSCDPGIDCGNDGDPGTGGVVIDETDDGEGTGATPGSTATPEATPSCAPGIDCNNDGGSSSTPAPTTGPTCPPGLDCSPDGPLPSSSSPSATCVPGIDCTNDGGSPTANPTTGSRSSTPTSTAQSSSTATAAPSNPGGGTGGIAAAPNTKIAYIGDTGDSNNFQAVLNLIKQEGAQAVVHSGDLSYTSSASTFISKVNATLGASFPYFMGQGNHDGGSWSQYVPRIPTQYVVAGTPSSANYAVNFQGVYIAFGKDKISTPSTFSGDLKLAQVQNTWKVCSFHEVHRAMHTGYKSTEIPYSIYDECRTYGAMTTNGHAHTYDRTVTLLSASGQQVDPSFPDPFSLRVARGVFFDLHNGASGRDPGTWERCKRTTDTSDVAGGKCDIFANRNGAVITRLGNPYGAAFITYNVDGDPHKARGYYMETNSPTHIDDFTIVAQ